MPTWLYSANENCYLGLPNRPLSYRGPLMRHFLSILTLAAIAVAFAALFMVSLGNAAPRSSESSVGSSNHFKSQTYSQVYIAGPSAEGLYRDLASRTGAEIQSCGSGKAVVVSPFICVANPSKTFCITTISENDEAFKIPSGICDGPEPSIIGVGNGKPEVTELNNEM